MAGFDWVAHEAEFENRPIANSERKKEMAEQKTILEIVGVRTANSKFGPSWVVDVNVGDKGETLFFSRGVERRDNLLAGMAEHFSENGVAPIKARLVQWGEPKEGRSPAWGLEPAE